jgi:excisionase family DNA binding protein
MNMTTKENLNLAEAAAELNISVRALRDLVKQGRISCSRVHRRAWVFTRADIDAFLQRNRYESRNVYR